MKAAVNSDDWHSVEKLLSDWHHEACINRDTNARKAQLNKRLHFGLGIPVVILSSIVGSAAFTQIGAGPHNWVRATAGVLSISAAVLAGLQTFLGFGESAEKYRAVGIGYEQITKEIEKIQALPVSLRGGVTERINGIEDQMNALAQGSPDVPDHEHIDSTLHVD